MEKLACLLALNYTRNAVGIEYVRRKHLLTLTTLELQVLTK